MDANVATGTRSDAQAVAFMQRRAIPKRLHQAKPSDLVKFPTSTVQQVIQRQQAEVAAQRGFPPSVNGVDADIIEKAQGLEGARRKAAGRVDFDAYAHHFANMQNIAKLQAQRHHNQEVLSAAGSVMNLQQALGSAPAELRPSQRADIERRANQLRSLVGSQSLDAQLAGGRALQQAYASGTRAPSLAENAPLMRGLLGQRATPSASSLSAQYEALSHLGREGFDSGYLPTQQ